MKEGKEKSLEDNTVCCDNIDLQKILTTPKSSIFVIYYTSKLCVWNFTIFELGNSVGTCNLWNETVGNMRSNKIASFVLKFI